MTVKELREMNLLIRGYAMPDDNAPCFYKRCKLSEALEILTEYVTDFPEDFYNLCFDVFTEDDECLFSIRRDLKTVYTTRTNKFNLNKKLIRKALGIKMPEMWHWYLYLAILVIVVIILVFAFYIPLLPRKKSK